MPRDEDVRWLDVPVNNPRGVRGFQRQRNLTENGQRCVDGERTILEAPLQCLAFVQSHDDEELRILFADGVDSADVGMIQRAGGLRFLEEARLGARVADQMAGKKLDRHRAPELEVGGPIENSHPACAQPLLQSEVRQDAPDEGIGCARRRKCLLWRRYGCVVDGRNGRRIGYRTLSFKWGRHGALGDWLST